MPNKDGTGNVKDGLKRVGIVLVYLLLLFAVGQLTGSWVLLTIVGGAGASVLAKLFTSAEWADTIFWGILGGVAGFLLWTTL